MVYMKKELFSFLLELRLNNNREWFLKNKERYEEQVRTPLFLFIEAFATPLKKISPNYNAIAKKTGGSLFRIQRDVRFSKDKSPYKTHAGIHFRHKNAKDAHAPGFYLHLSPDECFIAMGIWHPVGPALKKIRTGIADNPELWNNMKKSLGDLKLQGDSLTRPPNGFDKNHECIEDIKRKDFILSLSLRPDRVMTDDFLSFFEETCRQGMPLMKFITNALDIPS